MQHPHTHSVHLYLGHNSLGRKYFKILQKNMTRNFELETIINVFFMHGVSYDVNDAVDFDDHGW